MGWFKRHLNWTIIVGTIALPLICVLILYASGDLKNEYWLNLCSLAIFILTFIIDGWVLREKSRSLWWLLLNWLPVGWIIFMAIDNKTPKYDPIERSKVMDLVKLWMHTMKSLDLANAPMQSALTQEKDGAISKVEFESLVISALANVETIRALTLDTFQWPTLANSDANNIINEIKKKLEDFLNIESEGMQIMRNSTIESGSGLLIYNQDAKKIKIITKKLNQVGKQCGESIAKLVRLYRIPFEEYQEVIKAA